MADRSGAAGGRYRAFISYSHRDAVFAARLHRRLEGYVLPKRLRVERRLAPIFKDREELPAAHDLSAQVWAALAVSDCLIVICSPDAAASPWVGREIELFRELHPDRPILAALIRGEPAEAFPPALAEGGTEPLAADFRKQADGERLALLKLVAGIASVGVDQLVQRDAQRRLRGVMGVTAVAFVGMIAMAAMTSVALNARAEAERQRAEAESLVGFMLGDLRRQLRGVGRYSVLNSVNSRVLAYYNRQGAGRMNGRTLEQRSTLLHAMGEDDAGQGKLDKAAEYLDWAYRDTAALLAMAPEDPDRLFGHAQSAYWRGYLHYLRTQTPEARELWEEYNSLALRLIKNEPNSVRSLREVAYAQGNLCTLAIEQEGELSRALTTCQAALSGMQAALAREPHDATIALDVSTRWAELADVQTELGDYAAAEKSRLTQAQILSDLLIRDPDNAELADSWGACNRGLSLVAYRQGRVSDAIERLTIAGETFQKLSAKDRANLRWREQALYAERTIPILRRKLREKQQ